MWLEVGAVAVRGTANRALGWMGSCLALVLINAMEERAPKRKAGLQVIVERLHYAPFRRDRVRGGRAARGRSSGEAAVVASLEVAAVGPHRE